jgi:sulfopyruvate decarboxylase subunit beta
MRPTEFLEVFSRHRGDSPTMVASGVSGAVWRHEHIPGKTLYNSGMSYTVPACFGLALARPDLKVIAIEGDGSFLMGLAGLATVGRYKPPNLVHIVYNNKTYLPTGTSGELTSAAAHGADLAGFARAASLERVWDTEDAAEFDAMLADAMRTSGTSVIVATVELERESWDLKAPTRALDRVENAFEFQTNVRDSTPPTSGPVIEPKVPAPVPEVERKEPGWRAGAELYQALCKSGVDSVIYLPEGVLYPMQVLAERDPAMRTICCSREDEGVAIAGGIAVGGGVPALVVEGTGIGMSALALASLIVRGRPLVIISSHSRVLGVRTPWNDQAAMVNEPVLDALGIPVTVLEDRSRADLIMRETVRSARIFRKPAAIVIPPYLMDDESDH